MRYVFILLTVFLTACGTALPTVKPFKLDVQQGNVVNSKMLLQLRPGMTKSQVRFIMGTPLVQDSFHGNRWDYVYQMRESGKLKEQRRVILDFETELLKTVRGDVIASKGEQAQADAESANIGTRVVEAPAKTEEKGLLDRLKFWGKDEAELAQEAADLKAKTAAADTAKNAAPPTVENAAPTTQSILAVPLEVQPALESVTATTVLTPADTAPVAAAPTSAMLPPPVLEIVEEPIAAPVAATAAEPTPEKATGYESSSGMRFERTLKFSTETAAPSASSKGNAPRVGNKTVPTPKALPTDAEPSMFDRMLEKIGF